jgi:hypothetical protein
MGHYIRRVRRKASAHWAGTGRPERNYRRAAAEIQTIRFPRLDSLQAQCEAVSSNSSTRLKKGNTCAVMRSGTLSECRP